MNILTYAVQTRSYDNQLISQIMVVILFAFGLMNMLRSYRKEQDAGRRKLYLFQMAMFAALLVSLLVGMYLLRR